MTGRKILSRKVTERALAIHRANCEESACTGGPTREEWEQATREVMGSERETS